MRSKATVSFLALIILGVAQLFAQEVPYREPKWTFTMPSNMSPLFCADSNGDVYLVSNNFYSNTSLNGTLVKLDANGEGIWTNKLEYGNFGRPVLDSDGNVIVSIYANYFWDIAKYRRDGTLLKRVTTDFSPQEMSVTLDGSIYIATSTRCFDEHCQATYGLVRMDPALAQTTIIEAIYPYGFSGYATSIDGNRIFRLNGEKYGLLQSLDRDGSTNWFLNFDKPTFLSQNSTKPILGENVIYFVDEGARFQAFTQAGDLMWGFKTDGGILTPSIGADGVLYFGGYVANSVMDYAFYFYALNPDGTLRWQKEQERGVRGAPAIGSDGRIYTSNHGSGSNSGPGPAISAHSATGDPIWLYTNKNVFYFEEPIISGRMLYTIDKTNLFAFQLEADGAANSPWPMVNSSPKGDRREQLVKLPPVFDLEASYTDTNGFHLIVNGKPGAMIRLWGSRNLETWGLVDTVITESGRAEFLRPPNSPPMHFFRASQ